MTDEAQQALRDAEAALAKARAENAEAQQAFEKDPSQKTVSRSLIASQLAKNAEAPVEAAKAELDRVRRVELSAKLDDARKRASQDLLFTKTAPHEERLVELFDAILAEVAAIEAAVKKQNQASSDVEHIAAELGQYPAAPHKIPATLIRARVGVRLTHKIVKSGARYEVGREPATWLAARFDRGAASPDVAEIREAIKQVLPPDAWGLHSTAEYHQALADEAAFHEPDPNGRKQRWEV